MTKEGTIRVTKTIGGQNSRDFGFRPGAWLGQAEEMEKPSPAAIRASIRTMHARRCVLTRKGKCGASPEYLRPSATSGVGSIAWCAVRLMRQGKDEATP